MKRSLYFLIFNLLFFSTAALAGDLNPPGPPGPTMKPLDEVGSWSQTLSNEQRFKLVMNNEAVLDRETGLVWERSPSTADYKWEDAMRYCYQLYAGARRGWRPPSAEEISSLADAIAVLPKGSPFQVNANLVRWWTSTNALADANKAFIYPNGFSVNDGVKNNKASDIANIWCVRGPKGAGN